MCLFRHNGTFVLYIEVGLWLNLYIRFGITMDLLYIEPESWPNQSCRMFINGPVCNSLIVRTIFPWGGGGNFRSKNKSEYLVIYKKVSTFADEMYRFLHRNGASIREPHA